MRPMHARIESSDISSSGTLFQKTGDLRRSSSSDAARRSTRRASPFDDRSSARHASRLARLFSERRRDDSRTCAARSS